MRPKPIVLMILDGWGVSPSKSGNAINNAKTPNFDSYFSYFPSVSLQAAGITVGLPWGEVGNSEVGHTALGAGQILYQNSPRISIAIETEEFFHNEELVAAAKHARKNKSTLHLIGLVSPGGVHSAFNHVVALLDFAKKHKVKKVCIHAIMDGRDADPDGGLKYITELQKEIDKRKLGKIASMIGRFFAMDRNKSWDRTEKAYNVMARGVGKAAIDPIAAIKESYQNKVFDEYFEPTYIADKKGRPIGNIQDNDAVIFFNFRSDRSRQLTTAFALPGFMKFDRPEYIRNLYFVTMTEYEEALPVKVAFPPIRVVDPLAKVLSDQGFRQLHLAETEKYAHVTYFFNGGIEEPFLNEDRVLIPSKPTKSYADVPAMSAYEITDKLAEEVKRGFYDFVLVNYANPDMVGHTGNYEATIQAMETIDKLLPRIVDSVTGVGGVLLITGDHGNAEQMKSFDTGEVEKEHTSNPVPLLMISTFNGLEQPQDLASVQQALLTPAGILADVAPTILDLMGAQKPPSMTGESVLANIMTASTAEILGPT